MLCGFTSGNVLDQGQGERVKTIVHNRVNPSLSPQHLLESLCWQGESCGHTFKGLESN